MLSSNKIKNMNKPTLAFNRISCLKHPKHGLLLLLASILTLPACALLTQGISPEHSSRQFNTGLKTVHTLDLYADQNNLHVLFSGLDNKQQKPVLTYLQSRDGGDNWSTPLSINHGQTAIKKSKRGNDFQLAASGNTIMVVWRSQGAEPWTGKISAAISTDFGQKWQAVNGPLGKQYSNIDQGYFDLVAAADGYFHLSWLDDREEAGDTQGVRYARFNPDTATWDQHNTLEATACTCCWLNIEVDTDNHISLLYRDDSPRDMKLISSLDGGKIWLAAKTVGDFNWEFIGCPHQGGGLTTTQHNQGTQLHSAIWNGHNEGKGIYYSQTSLIQDKQTLLKPIAGNSSSSADIAALSAQSIRIVYTSGSYESKSVITKYSQDGGLSWSAEQRLTAEGAEPSHPRIVAINNRYHLFWTEWQKNGDALAIISKIN